jgi:hypothetical protein
MKVFAKYGVVCVVLHRISLPPIQPSTYDFSLLQGREMEDEISKKILNYCG